jgi:hypothetical protein
MLIILGVALFAAFGLMGSAESSGALAATPVVTPVGPDLEVGPYVQANVVATGRAAIQSLTAVITKVITEWWPTALMLDWMQTVHRVWPSVHRLAGTSPPQP